MSSFSKDPYEIIPETEGSDLSREQRYPWK